MHVVRVCVFPRSKRAAMSAARDPGSSAARRRRERRLRSFLRHERMAVAMAVAEARHHSSRGQMTATAFSEMEEQEKNNAPRQKAPPPGMRPASLAETQGTQVALQRHVAEQVLYAPVVQILAAPVPQMVDQLDVLKILGMQLPVVPEQVIAVPKISCLSRSSQTFLSEPQRAEQLVEVPTVLSYALLQQRTMEQTVDIPVPFGGRPLHGFHTGQGSAAFTEQLVDTRARRGARVRGGGAQGSVPGQGSTAPRGAQPCVGRQSRRFTGRIFLVFPAWSEFNSVY